MASSLVEKVSGGYRVDGLDLLEGGGHRAPGSGGPEVDTCRQTYSMVKRIGNVVAFFAKAATAKTRDNFEWGYRVKKGWVEVDVLVYDSWNADNLPFGGHYPPPLSAWEECGWQILSQFQRPLKVANHREDEGL